MRFTLQPKQRKVLDLITAIGPDVPRRIGYGGSRGAAKSRCGRDIALYTAIVTARTYPGILIYVVARNYGNLEDNYIKKYRNERPEIMEYFRASPRPEITFPEHLGGSVIAFRYADSENDITQLERGPEAFLVIVEQAEQYSGEQLRQLTKPNRWPNAPSSAAKSLFLFNPGGIGTIELQRLFYLKKYHDNERGTDYAFIQAFGWDNYAWFEKDCPDLSWDEFYKLPGEIPPCPDGKYDNEWLRNVSDSERFKIYVTQTGEGKKYWQMPESSRLGDLFGRFDQFAGQYFAGVWDPRICVISEKQVDAIVPYWWTAWVSGDWGFGHRAAVYWFCCGVLKPSEALFHLGIKTDWPVSIIIVYRELIPPERTAEGEFGQRILDVTPKEERAHLSKWVMGSDVETAPRFAPHTIREMIEAVTTPGGMPPIHDAQDGPGSRVTNARVCYEMLRRTAMLRSENPPADRPDERTPPIILISAECPNLIQSIPLLIADEKKPDDVKKLNNLGDDCFDGWKYGCAEYLQVRDMAPREVRREEVMNAAPNNTAKYLAMLKFDHEEEQQEKRARKR